MTALRLRQFDYHPPLVVMEPEAEPDLITSALQRHLFFSGYVATAPSFARLGGEPETTASPAMPVPAAAAITQPRDCLLAIHKLANLTWEDIAGLFGVSRRSVHFWLNGEDLKAQHRDKLYAVYDVIQRIARSSAQETRNMLLQVDRHGRNGLDLLRAGSYDEAIDRFGAMSCRVVMARNHQPLPPTLPLMAYSEQADEPVIRRASGRVLKKRIRLPKSEL